MKRFQLWRSPQSQSPLLDLPAELRVKILRYVLRKEGPITSLKEVQVNSHPDSNFHEIYDANAMLSAQILRTCQQLHEEAEQILYKENILFICYNGNRFGSRGPDDLCHNLDFSINLSASRIEELSGTFVTIQDYFVGRESTMGPYTVSRYSQLMKFQHYRLKICYSCRESILTACRVLQPLLLDKDVTLMSRRITPCWFIYHLRCARYLRCRSLQIQWPKKHG